MHVGAWQNSCLTLLYALQIREREANLDVLIMPIEDMYGLLAR